MKKIIDETNDALKEYVGDLKNEENIFNLGIKLGQFLANSGEKYERLPIFIERENNKNNELRIKEKIDLIRTLVGKFFYAACLLKLKNGDAIRCEDGQYFNDKEKFFNDEIESQLNIAVISIEQEDEDQDYLIKYKFIGSVGNIFDEYGVDGNFEVQVFNLDCSPSLTIATVNVFKELIGRSNFQSRRELSNIDEKRLDDFIEKLNKATMFTQLKYSQEFSQSSH